MATHEALDFVIRGSTPLSRVMDTHYVVDHGSLTKVARALAESDIVALDIETTGLSPFTDRIRLLTLSTESSTFLLDAFSVDMRCLFPILCNRLIVGQNLLFDLSFLWQLGCCPGRVADIMLLSQVVYAGTKEDDGKLLAHSLDAIARRELGETLDKSLQKSDFSGILTPEQLDYAARDAQVLIPCYRRLMSKVRVFGLETVADIEMRCLPAMLWMTMAGVPFNVEKWRELLRHSQTEAQRVKAALDATAVFAGAQNDVNWNSWQQVLQVLALEGVTLVNTREETLAACDHPVAALLLEYREYQKRISTYGDSWFKFIAPDHRIHPHWGQNFTATGRMSCNTPNLQNLPRDKRYRSCFASGNGRKLVIVDYSQIELRIAAKVSNDPTMLEAYRQAGDLHTKTAQAILGKQDVTKDDRQIAKSANFALIYGAGVDKFQRYSKTTYHIDLSYDEANRVRNTFFGTYPKLRDWHRRHGHDTINTRTLAGRVRWGVEKFTEQLNTPIQGTGADGLKLALALLWERRAEGYGYYPILAAHDELVIEGPEDYAEQAAEWLTRNMKDGMAWMIAPVEVGVEAKIAKDWGAK